MAFWVEMEEMNSNARIILLKGNPEVECGRDFVHFRVATKKAFTGRVYVKGEFGNPKCVETTSKNGGEEEEEGEENRLNIGHGKAGFGGEFVGFGRTTYVLMN